MLSDSVSLKKPLVHCISNIVSANDCANLLLAIGASPIMAQAPEEMEEISSISDALVLNTGTPSEEKFKACRIAGITANSRRIPVILDPVGIGASSWRLKHINGLLSEIHPSIIRANNAEARALLGIFGLEHGVDSEQDETGTEAELAMRLAQKYNCTVLLSGRDDIISDCHSTATISGGSLRMKQITGAGCMLSVLCGAFAAVADPFDAAKAGAKLWKKAAEYAEKTAENKGPGSFHYALFDSVSSVKI